MRRFIVIIIAAALVVGSWFWTGPYFAIAGLRNAVIRGDTSALEKHVDFPRLRESVRTQMSAFMMARMKESLSDNPFAALGLALAAKLTDVMVESMVTPTGMLALMDIKTDGASEVSGFALMTSSDIEIRRDSLDSFDFYPAKGTEQIPTLRFARDGVQWRLVGFQMPKEFLKARIPSAGTGRPAASPYVPKWELSEHKDPMDDRVSVILRRDADEEVSSGYSKVRPVMFFRCQKKKLEAFINVRGMVDYEYETNRSAVRLRFDDEKARLESWSASKDREALFAPNPKTFLRTLRASSVLLFEWRRNDERTTVTKFTKGDFDSHVDKFAVACGIEKLIVSVPGK